MDEISIPVHESYAYLTAIRTQSKGVGSKIVSRIRIIAIEFRARIPVSPTAEENKRLARRIPEEILSEGKLDLVEELFVKDAVDQAPLGKDTGWDEIRAGMETMRGAFPDLTATVEDAVSEGDTVAMRITLRGTHEGEFMGREPTGKTIEVGSMIFTRIESGKIVERWAQPDTLGLFQQLDIATFPTEQRGAEHSN